jgi:AraC-like DNA-binding protein
MASSPFYFQQPFCQLATACRVLEMDPPADLAPFIAKLGFVKIDANYVRQVVPDGCFALGIGIHEASGVARSFVRGPKLNWGHWPVSQGWSYVDARFRWGAGMRFLRCSPEDTSYGARLATEVLGPEWNFVVERVAAIKTARGRMSEFVEGLRKIAPPPSALRPELSHTIRLLERGKPWLKVDDLADAACLSSSQLRRLFSKELGASPKDLLRLSRVWWSMRLAIEHPEMAWGSIAAESGFSDQAHLVDEYRHFTGFANLYGVGSAAAAPPRHGIVLRA